MTLTKAADVFLDLSDLQVLVVYESAGREEIRLAVSVYALCQN